METQAGVEAVNPIKASLLGATTNGNQCYRADLNLGFLWISTEEDKPMWWRKFDRIAASVEELATTSRVCHRCKLSAVRAGKALVGADLFLLIR
jgi:hypothetical protein